MPTMIDIVQILICLGILALAVAVNNDTRRLARATHDLKDNLHIMTDVLLKKLKDLRNES